MIALGGWGFNSETTWDGKGCPRACPKVFTTMVASAGNRARFIGNAIQWCRQFNFDGIDLDWEYPGITSRGGSYADKQNFARLAAEFRAAIEAEAVPEGREKLLLSAAVGIGPEPLLRGYDIPSLSQSLDWVGLMAYDLHGAWDGYTGK